MEGLGAVLRVFERTLDGIRVIDLLALGWLVGSLWTLRGARVLDRYDRLGGRATGVRTLERGI